jgi:transposase
MKTVSHDERGGVRTPALAPRSVDDIQALLQKARARLSAALMSELETTNNVEEALERAAAKLDLEDETEDYNEDDNFEDDEDDNESLDTLLDGTIYAQKSDIFEGGWLFESYKDDSSMTDSPLTKAQTRVVQCLLSGDYGVALTYEQVARKLGVSVGTVYRQLKRVRDQHPDVYRTVMSWRKWQLENRHEAAVERAKQRTARWFRRKRARAYKEKYGVYPWELRQKVH